jgi:hypothetical protein
MMILPRQARDKHRERITGMAWHSTWEAKAGDAILVDGRTWYNQDLLGQEGSGAILAFEFRSKKEKNESVQVRFFEPAILI